MAPLGTMLRLMHMQASTVGKLVRHAQSVPFILLDLR